MKQKSLYKSGKMLILYKNESLLGFLIWIHSVHNWELLFEVLWWFIA